MSGLPEILILVAVFAAVALVVVGVAGLLTRDPALRRMQAGPSEDRPNSIFYEKKNTRLIDMLAPLQKQLTQGDVKQVGIVKGRLIEAGFYQPTALQVYYTIRFVLAVVLAAAASFAIVLLLPPMGATAAMAIVLAAAAAGYYFPTIALFMIISHRRTQFRYGMPDAMDMILVGVEAGLSLPAAIQHLCDEFEEAHPIIAEQFRIVTLEFQAGRSRADALAALANRMKVPEAKVFSTMIAQAESLGTSLGVTLRVISDEMRRDRMLRAEQRANELPVKMAIPLVLLIFPALFNVIIAPLIIRIFRTLSGIGS